MTILPRDTSVVMNDGDQFALLACLFWYKVRVVKNNSEGGDNSKLDIVQDVTIENNITPSYVSKNEITNSDTTVDINHTTSTNKRNHTKENLITKRQKISNGSADELNKPSTSTNSSCLLHTLPDIKSENFTCSENFDQNIDSVKLISNLKNIVEEDYGNKNDECQNMKQIFSTENDKVDFKTEKKKDTRTEEKHDIKTEGNVSDDKTVESYNLETHDSDGDNKNKCNLQITSSNGITDSKDKVQEKVQSDGISINESDNFNKASCSTDNKNVCRERCWYGPNCYR